MSGIDCIDHLDFRFVFKTRFVISTKLDHRFLGPCALIINIKRDNLIINMSTIFERIKKVLFFLDPIIACGSDGSIGTESNESVDLACFVSLSQSFNGKKEATVGEFSEVGFESEVE